MDFISYIYFFYYYYIKYFFLVKDSYKNSLNSFAFYFIFLTFFSNNLLKNKLYKHHYISIIIIIVLDLLNNIIAGDSIIEENKRYQGYGIYIRYFSFLIIIIYILLYSLKIVLYKYYMLIKYIQPYEILFFEGLFLSVLLIITVILYTNTDIYNSAYTYFNFKYYYKNLNTEEIVILVSLTLIYFIYNLLQLIIINYFSPFYILLINLIPENLLN